MAMPLQELIDQIAGGKMHVHVGRTFHLDEIVEAHRLMESNAASGKIVGLPNAVVVKIGTVPRRTAKTRSDAPVRDRPAYASSQRRM